MEVSASVSGLSANTTYSYRIAATNATGISYGSERTFKTAQTAAPELPELGRCVKLAGNATGRYKTTACTVTSSGENTGKYEWLPWPAVKNQFSVKGGAATLETVARTTVKCHANTYTGEYTAAQTETVAITFTGCEATGGLGGKCQSEAAATGEIKSSLLEGKLGFIKSGTKPSAGWDLKPVSQPDLASFKCGEAKVSLTGSVIAPVTALDKTTATFKLKYKASKGKQTPEKLETGPPDTLSLLGEHGEEKAGLTMSESIVNAEAVEIKALA